MSGDPNNKQKVDFSGKLDLDTSLEKVKQSDYTGALNINFLTNDTQSTRSHIPMLGNEFAFDLGSVAVQNKKWRIFTLQAAFTGKIYLYDQNGNLFPTINGQVQPMTWNRNQTLANQAAAILALFATIDGAGTTSVIAGVDYVDIVTNTIPGYDLGLVATTTTVTTDANLVYQIMAEAYDLSLSGELNDIASNDLLGDLMLLSTPQKNMPVIITPTITTVTIVGAPGPVNNKYLVTTSAAHGLTTGMKVVISGINIATPGTTSPNGIWIVTVVSPTTFTLDEWYNTTFGFTQGAAGGTISIYNEGVGEIGVAQKDVNTDAWTYTRLLRTKQWNFRTKKQPDFRISERTLIKDSDYWTDNYNIMRAFYYKRPVNGIFINSAYNSTTGLGDLDGAIQTINPNGYYAYENVSEETKLLLAPPNVKVRFVTQSNSGGKVTSGNWRYSVRFLTDALVSTEWTDLTNPINVFLASTSNPYLIIGDAPAVITSKINNLQVTGINPGLFKYIELGGVNYVGAAIEGFIIKRVLLDGIATSLNISHTGTETGILSLDLGTLNAKNVLIVKAKNMDSVDKRMVLSNVTLAQQIDLTAWVQTFKHTLHQKSLDSVRGSIQGTLRMAEYQDPQNVNNYVGYMQNEVYRYGFKVRFKATGFWSDVFWCDDIAFTTYGTNLKPDGTTLASPTNRRTAAGGLANFDLTDATGVTTTIYVPYVNINSIDLNYLIDGVRVGDLIDQIKPMRAECIPEVIAAGVGVLSIYGSANVDSVSGNAWIISSASPAVNPYFGGPHKLIEYPFVSGRDGIGGAPNNPAYPNNSGAFGDRMDANRRFAAFYSPDIWFGHTSISFNSSDQIINYGSPTYVAFNLGYASIADAYSNVAQVSGRTSTSNVGVQMQTIASSTDVVLLEKGTSVVIGADTFYKNNPVTAPGGANGFADSATGYLFHAPADFTNPSGFPDYGLRYMQYYRALVNKYGDTNLTIYVSCGDAIAIDSNTATPMNVDVFGGDTFTQLTYFKHRYGNTIDSGLAGGLTYYSQNRVNAQMKQKSASQTGNLYPGIPSVDWLETPSNIDGTQGEAYQEGYTIRNQAKSDVAFDSNLEQFVYLPVSFFWSDVKLLDSPTDGYRKILPLNRHDLDNTNGEIMHHGKSSSELISWQARAFMRQYFNTRGTLEVKGITEILIGDGSVMSRDGVTMSRFGSLNKWSVIQGVSPNGDDVYMWINTEMKNVVHYSSNGTLTVSDEWMKSFFANNLTWVEGKDTPADEEGICGVYDQRYNNFIFTVRGRRVTPYAWSDLVDYSSIGQLIYYRPTSTPFSTFEKTGELFLLKFANGPSTVVVVPVAVYPLPNVISTLTGTTVLTITTASPHLLVTGDQVKFRSISGLSSDITEVFLTVTVTGASTFTVTVSALINAYVGSSGSIVEVNPKYWTFIPHTNNNYYNEYTAIFNGFKYGFITFASFLPRIYNRWKNTFLSPRPIIPVSKIYLHNKGSYLTWYLDSGVSQQVKGYIEAIINKFDDQTKWFVTIGIDSDIQPDGMSFTTKDHISFLLTGDFEQFENSWLSPIKEDSTVTVTNPAGLNDSNTSLLFGKYLKARFSFAVGIYQKLSNFVVNFDVSKILK